jgi:predicted NAD/FAD-binding protein
MPTIQNTRGISYAGAWMGYGFHEDGFTAGLNAAVALGAVKLPFDIRPPDRRVSALWTADVFNVLERMRRLISGLLWVLLGIVSIMF